MRGLKNRKSIRYNRKTKAIVQSFDGKKMIEVDLVNLSHSGALIGFSNETKWSLGFNVYVEIDGPSSPLIQAKLKRTERIFGQYQFAIQFVNTSRKAQHMIATMSVDCHANYDQEVDLAV